MTWGHFPHGAARREPDGYRRPSLFLQEPGSHRLVARIDAHAGRPSFDDRLLGREKPLEPGGPDPETEDRVMLVRRRVSRIYYARHFFDYPISMKWQTIRNMGFFTTLRAGFSYLAACVHKLPETSLENFYINRFGRVLYSMFSKATPKAVGAASPGNIGRLGGTAGKRAVHPGGAEGYVRQTPARKTKEKSGRSRPL